MNWWYVTPDNRVWSKNEAVKEGEQTDYFLEKKSYGKSFGPVKEDEWTGEQKKKASYRDFSRNKIYIILEWDITTDVSWKDEE